MKNEDIIAQYNMQLNEDLEIYLQQQQYENLYE
jgi:hypothetical protein